MPEGSDFTMPDRGDFQMPEGSDFTMPDGGDFQMPEGSDFTMPDRGDFQMPEGSDFTMPEGGDFQMPEGSDFTMSEEGETEGTGEAGEPESDSEISDSELPSRADEDKEQETEAEDDTEKNLEQIILSDSDVEDIELFVPGISAVTLSYSTKSTVDGGELEAETSYTIAGVKSNYAAISNLEIAVGSFIEDDDETNKQKICVLGATAAKEIFGSAMDAYDSVLYIDGRSYVVNGVLEAIGTVSSGISPDEAIFVPYATGVKYITGENINPTLTVLAEDATSVDQTIEKITAVLAETYPNAEFTFTDAGSKMEAAEQSNSILTILLTAMAAIVFVVGGIGIMNVLFVAVKERTEEIGILKAIGCTRKDILLDFLLEAAIISLIGGILGIGLSFAVEPVATYLGVRVEMTANAWIIALAFAIGTGTIFGFYPAWKASRLLPVQALNQE